MIQSPDFIQKCSMGASYRPLSVVVVGAGGTGSALLNQLFQMHTTLVKLGNLGLDVTVYDDDIVSASNVGRQAFWPSDLHQKKAEVLVNRYNQFGNLSWKAVGQKFDGKIRFNDTVLFGCVDSVEGRKRLHFTMLNCKNMLYIDAGNDAHSANVILGMNAAVAGKHTYLPSVYDLFKAQLDEPRVEMEPSCSTEEAIARQDFGVNSFAATHAAQMLWQLFRHGQIAYQGCVIDLHKGSSMPIAADPIVWSMFGYDITKAA